MILSLTDCLFQQLCRDISFERVMERKIEFDIIKGILIILVVVGHTSYIMPAIDVYWFHMPSFFMISGYFYKRNQKIDFLTKLKGNIKRYAIPYFCFCVLMYFLSLFVTSCPHVPVTNYVAKSLYGGLMNITWFSYPFWFINTLLCSIIVLNIFDKVSIKYLIFVAIVMFLTSYIPLVKSLKIPLPWGIDCVLVSVLYMVAGYGFNFYKYNKWHNVIFIIPILLVSVIALTGSNYRLDIAAKFMSNPVLDVIIPLSFFWCIWKISVWLSKIPIVSSWLSLLGQCCMTIFFVHAFCIAFSKQIGAPIVLQVLIGLSLGILLHYLFSYNKYLSKLFLGKTKKSYYGKV